MTQQAAVRNQVTDELLHEARRQRITSWTRRLFRYLCIGVLVVLVLGIDHGTWFLELGVALALALLSGAVLLAGPPPPSWLQQSAAKYRKRHGSDVPRPTGPPSAERAWRHLYVRTRRPTKRKRRRRHRVPGEIVLTRQDQLPPLPVLLETRHKRRVRAGWLAAVAGPAGSLFIASFIGGRWAAAGLPVLALGIGASVVGAAVFWLRAGRGNPEVRTEAAEWWRYAEKRALSPWPGHAPRAHQVKLVMPVVAVIGLLLTPPFARWAADSVAVAAGLRGVEVRVDHVELTSGGPRRLPSATGYVVAPPEYAGREVSLSLPGTPGTYYLVEPDGDEAFMRGLGIGLLLALFALFVVLAMAYMATAVVDTVVRQRKWRRAQPPLAWPACG